MPTRAEVVVALAFITLAMWLAVTAKPQVWNAVGITPRSGEATP